MFRKRRQFGSDCAVAAPVGDDTAVAEPCGGVGFVAGSVPHLEVQVRPGGPATVSDGGDLLAGAHALARRHLVGVDVAVDGGGAVVVLDANPLTVARCRARVEDRAVGRDCIGVPIGAAMSIPP